MGHQISRSRARCSLRWTIGSCWRTGSHYVTKKVDAGLLAADWTACVQQRCRGRWTWIGIKSKGLSGSPKMPRCAWSVLAHAQYRQQIDDPGYSWIRRAISATRCWTSASLDRLSTFRRSRGSVLDPRRLKRQSANSTLIPSVRSTLGSCGR